MKKARRIIAVLTAAVLVLAMVPSTGFAALSFSDVPESAWYYSEVQNAVALDLINGKTPTTFAPNDNLTYAEAVKLAACMHQRNQEGSVTLKNGSPWYQSYVDYAKRYQIITRDYEWQSPATRADYMEIFSNALTSNDLLETNTVDDGTIPDVSASSSAITESQYEAIYRLYRAGILQGSDAQHNCYPLKNIQRCEVAAILCRIMNKAKRLTFSITSADRFSDVKKSSWYYDDVRNAVNLGLINGKTSTTFAPKDNLTYAEAVKLAACMHQQNTEGSVTLKNGSPWYQSYVDYAFANDILNKNYDWNAPATRAGFMEIMAAVPSVDYSQRNIVDNGMIPDVSLDKGLTETEYDAIYKMYRAGILQGSDAEHRCYPFNNIQRAEVAAMLSRMTIQEKRLTFSLTRDPKEIIKAGDTVAFGKYEQDADLSNGRENIEWRVLDVKDGKLLITSKYLLDAVPFNDHGAVCTWESSSIRTWLNNDFYNEAFDQTEKSSIVKGTVTMDKNLNYDTDPGNSTEDSVFLLSLDEALAYFTNNIDRRCDPTAYAAKRGALQMPGALEEGLYSSYWWLRTPGWDEGEKVAVTSRGDIQTDGAVSHAFYFCARPAMWVSADAVSAVPEPSYDFSDAKAGDIITFGHYEQDNDTSNGKEPIQWQVLDKKDGKILVASKYILDDNYGSQYAGGYDKFYQHAFTEQEKKYIALTTLHQSLPGGEFEYLRYLFNMDSSEAGLFESDEARMAKPTAYLAGKRNLDKTKNLTWMLRTVSGYRDTYYVSLDGKIYWTVNGEFFADNKDWLYYRQAMWLITDPDQIEEPKTLKAGDEITFGEYEKGGFSANSKEPIVWQVLDTQPGKALVISKYALVNKEYNEEDTDVTWADSSLRKWLNGEFYSTVFESEEDRSSIILSRVTADRNPKSSVDPGNDIYDKMFLLSVPEAEKYIPSDSDRIGINQWGTKCMWWLRSPGNRANNPTYVSSADGKIYGNNLSTASPIYVRPAMWIQTGYGLDW